MLTVSIVGHILLESFQCNLVQICTRPFLMSLVPGRGLGTIAAVPISSWSGPPLPIIVSSLQGGMAFAHNYSRYRTLAINQRATPSIMTTTFSQPFMPKSDLPVSPDTNWKSAVFEPLLVVGACLFWLAVLPVTGVFCAGVALYDKVASLKTGSLRLPDLRYSAVNNPLVLRKKSAPEQSTAAQTSSAARAFQS